MSKLFVRPAAGLKVRHATRRRHLRATGEWVADEVYYRRRIAAGDLEHLAGADAARAEAIGDLVQAIQRLDQADPSHFTRGGEPSLNHLTDLLGRRVSREDVDQACAFIERT